MKGIEQTGKVTSDIEIICMIGNQQSRGWKCLYDKYALSMFVAILWATDDEILAAKILRLLFVQLKTNAYLLETKKTLPQSLLYHTNNMSSKVLMANEIMISNPQRRNQPFQM